MKNSRKTLPQKKSCFAVAAAALAVLMACVFLMGATTKAPTQAAALSLGVSGNPANVDITIEKPKGWLTKETPVKIKIDAVVAVAKVEAKTSSNGSYTDITDEMQIDISENCTVYIQVTDKNGAVYSKSRYIEVFDRTAPTVKARIDKKLLRIEADDDLSGIAAVYVDGEKYTDLTNDTIDIPIRELGKEYPEFEVQAVDAAGNKSKIVTVKNPNYKDDSENKSLNSNATSGDTGQQDGTGTVQDTKEQGGTATATNTTPPTTTSSGAQDSNSPYNPDTGSISPETTSSGGGGSSDAPLFGTYEDTKKQFMSIVTSDGAVYYLIIDHDKESENVYFLSPVTNSELASFVPQTEQTEESEDYPAFIGEQPKEAEEEIGFIDDTPQEQADDAPDDEEAEAPAGDEDATEQPKSGGGIPILLIVAILGIGGAGYYFKIYKPKKELETVDDLDDFAFAEGEEDTDNRQSDDELMFDE